MPKKYWIRNALKQPKQPEKNKNIVIKEVGGCAGCGNCGGCGSCVGVVALWEM